MVANAFLKTVWRITDLHLELLRKEKWKSTEFAKSCFIQFTLPNKLRKFK